MSITALVLNMGIAAVTISRDFYVIYAPLEYDIMFIHILCNTV